MFSSRNLQQSDLEGEGPNDEKENNIEKDYELIGVTGVEDLLQDNVKDVITDFMKADIKVWMLTGDKGATARNIGKTCGIIEDSMEVHAIKEDGDITKELERLHKAIVTNMKNL